MSDEPQDGADLSSDTSSQNKEEKLIGKELENESSQVDKIENVIIESSGISDTSESSINNKSEDSQEEPHSGIHQSDIDSYIDTLEDDPIDFEAFKKINQENPDELNYEELTELEREMSTFDPTEVVNISLDPFEQRKIYINIIKTNQKVKVAYFLLIEKGEVQYKFYKTKNDIIREGILNHDIFTFDSQETGLYTLEFLNLENQPISLTIAFQNEEERNNFINKDDLTNMTTKLYQVNRKSKQLEILKKQISLKYSYHIDTSRDHNKKIVVYSLVELLVVVVIIVIQMKYVLTLAKRL